MILQTKTLVFIILLLFLQASCADKSNNRQASPSGNYSFYTSIENFNIIIHLVDKNNNEISVVDTRASDVMKWAIGWMSKKDTVVLNSSDIGYYAYIIENQKLIKLKYLTKEMCLRANDLYSKKYDKTSPSSDC